MVRLKPGALAALLVLSFNLTTYAAQDRVPASADVAEYEPVLDQIKQCVTCHGDNGITLQPTFPILSGQHFYYLYVQLKDFKSGRRDNAIMGPIASQLSKSQMKLLAKYFSEQDWPDIRFRTDSAIEAQGATATIRLRSHGTAGRHVGTAN